MTGCRVTKIVKMDVFKASFCSGVFKSSFKVETWGRFYSDRFNTVLREKHMNVNFEIQRSNGAKYVFSNFCKGYVSHVCFCYGETDQSCIEIDIAPR